MNKSQKLRKLLEEHSKVITDIEDIAVPLYRKRNDLLKKILPLMMEKKAPGVCGLLTSPLTIKYRDGRSWKLQPNYVYKNGEFKGAVYKNQGIELFTVTERKERKSNVD